MHKFKIVCTKINISLIQFSTNLLRYPHTLIKIWHLQVAVSFAHCLSHDLRSINHINLTAEPKITSNENWNPSILSLHACISLSDPPSQAMLPTNLVEVPGLINALGSDPIYKPSASLTLLKAHRARIFLSTTAIFKVDSWSSKSFASWSENFSHTLVIA